MFRLGLGEVLSPTQTYPADLPALVPQTIKPDDAYGSTWFSRGPNRRRKLWNSGST